MNNEVLKLIETFRNVQFIDENHEYIYDGESYPSVTGVISEYQNKFDTYYWTRYIALKRMGYRLWPGKKERPNQTVFLMNNEIPIEDYHHYTDIKAEDIEKEWKKKADDARNRGHHFHDYLESGVWGKRNKEKIDVLENFLEDYRSSHIPVLTEFIVGDFDIRFFGQFDNLSFNDGYTLIDYKTDEEIKFSNKYDKLHPPFDHLDDCSFNKYTVQLNMYKHSIEKYSDIKIKSMHIVHFSDEEYKWIPIEDMNIKTLLDDYYSKRTEYV